MAEYIFKIKLTTLVDLRYGRRCCFFCSAVLKLVQECVVSFVYQVVIVNTREPNRRASTQITSQIYETDEEAILSKMKLYDFDVMRFAFIPTKPRKE